MECTHNLMVPHGICNTNYELYHKQQHKRIILYSKYNIQQINSELRTILCEKPD